MTLPTCGSGSFPARPVWSPRGLLLVTFHFFLESLFEIKESLLGRAWWAIPPQNTKLGLTCVKKHKTTCF